MYIILRSDHLAEFIPLVIELDTKTNICNVKIHV